MSTKVWMYWQFVAAALLGAAASVSADVFSYECNTLPEGTGWLRSDRLFPPERRLSDGWFFQEPEIVAPGPPQIGEDDFYRRTLADFAGEDTLFVEWRMQTDGPEAFSNVAPAGLAASGRMGVSYHFTIAEDQVRFIRDTQLPILWIDIDAGVPHTYRLELYGEDWYVWYIDGRLVDSGVPEGRYPESDSTLVFGATASGEANTTKWDYIRLGTIPEEASGDYDSDGDVDAHDFEIFEECFLGTAHDAGPGCRFADFDADNDVDLLDYAAFQLTFTGGK